MSRHGVACAQRDSGSERPSTGLGHATGTSSHLWSRFHQVRALSKPDPKMAEFDQLAEHYDETRGGETRGEEYAADIHAYLPSGDGPILEIGVGTGVVALGLRRLGRTVV